MAELSKEWQHNKYEVLQDFEGCRIGTLIEAEILMYRFYQQHMRDCAKKLMHIPWMMFLLFTPLFLFGFNTNIIITYFALACTAMILTFLILSFKVRRAAMSVSAQKIEYLKENGYIKPKFNFSGI